MSHLKEKICIFTVTWDFFFDGFWSDHSLGIQSIRVKLATLSAIKRTFSRYATPPVDHPVMILGGPIASFQFSSIGISQSDGGGEGREGSTPTPLDPSDPNRPVEGAINS